VCSVVWCADWFAGVRCGTTVYETDLVVLSLGVRPCVALAQAAGLKVNKGVVIDDFCRASLANGDVLPDVYACGDVAESRDFITHEYTTIGLAGPALKQGRIAGANSVLDRPTYKVLQA
jgi:NAD(P)H-nitrite reductase large subunit